ncbi:MAG: CRTAC1 family protein [Acidobacteria bacterium]|nr:CRTAC1 family protein [Acidobacteriota bacterium]
MFRDVAEAAGISFRHERGARGDWHPVETMGSGVAVLDYDTDGAPDLFFVQGGEVPGTGRPPGLVGTLYRNEGDGRFRDVSEPAGFGAPAPVEGHGMGAVAADYDTDGDPDLLVTRAGTDLLYENRGDGTFALREAGLNAAGWAASAAFSDLDGDGDLDLFITHYLDWSPANNPVCARTIAGEPVRSYCLPDAFSGVPDLLYENRGDGSFRDVTDAAGVGLRAGKGLGVLAADLVGDALPDLYVANDTVPNFLFENLGELRFRERGLPAGLAYDGDGNALAGMGIAVADIESDGDLDLFVTNFQGEANNLYVSDRHGVFRDVSFLSGVGRPSLDWLGFGAVFADLDNDGAADLCVTNGHVLDNAPLLYPGTDYRQRDVCFRNLGGTFEPVVLEGPAAVGRGLAAADFDADGFLDLVMSRSGGRPALLQNGSAPAPRAVLRLVGRVSNRDGVGAEVVVERGGRPQRSVVTAGSSYLSSGTREVWIGLGHGAPDSVRVRWPTGAEQAVPVDRAGEFLVVEEILPAGRQPRR